MADRVLGLGGRQWLIVAACVAAGYLLVSTVALTGLWAELHRAPTNAELQQAANVEVAGRWQAWRAGRIFPDQVPYEVVGEGEYARRVGMDSRTDCAGGVDETIVPILVRHGCRAVLRATYLDQLQGIVITVGVVAFPDEQAAYQARRELPTDPTTLRALPLPGTPAARFTDPARQDGSGERAGPYIILTTAGQADGRPAVTVRKGRAGIFDVAPQLAHAIGVPLAQRSLPDCKAEEWTC
ncbi:hypothetical protein ACRYCC_12735 [Actinomadura scrupuli]|uniref:hypothetical protein n=1 Tax=Actinomadura scrupuli TaxID=559629 RepID=UPI003D984333